MVQERHTLPTGAGIVDAEGAICHAVGNSELTAKRLVEYALEHHKIGVEGQTMVIIDECQIIFNCRDFGRKDRGTWVTLFSQHRKLNNYGFGGLLISLTGMTWFIAIEYWYGGNKLMLSKQIFAYHKKYSKVYDSYKLFSDMEEPIDPKKEKKERKRAKKAAGMLAQEQSSVDAESSGSGGDRRCTHCHTKFAAWHGCSRGTVRRRKSAGNRT